MVARKKERADVLLFERGLAPSRERAKALVLAGRVFSGEMRIEKAGQLLPAEIDLTVRGDANPYVSRGGLKLAGALDDFDLDVAGRVAGDIGASTGGFTDCLLQRGAARVYAVDVGYGQLHAKLRSDSRVVVMERTNARYLSSETLPEPLDLVVVDASFIGLAKLLPAIRAILAPNAEVVALVKPQFEVGADRVGKGGVVRDDAVREASATRVSEAAAELGFRRLGQTDSKVAGPKGNREIFLHLGLG